MGTLSRVSIYPHLTRAVAQKQAKFGEAKWVLNTGLLHPARLRVTLPDGKDCSFVDSVAATVFAKQLSAMLCRDEVRYPNRAWNPVSGLALWP